MSKNECVKCGYCCRVGVCKYGFWNSILKQCQYLSDENLCIIYEKIKDDKEIGFGMGCSSTIGNIYRNKIIEEREKNKKIEELDLIFDC